MFIGVIKTKDVLLNPRAIIAMRGLGGYLKLILRAFSRKRYPFINMVEETEWIQHPKKSSHHHD